MKIAVVGAGIVGIATAYELICDGHEVTVFDQNSMAAEESSFANAGLIAPSHFLPLSTPAWPSAPLMQVLRRLSHVDIRGIPNLRDLKWIWNWTHSTDPEKFLANATQSQALTSLGQMRIREISSGSRFEYERSDGQLALLRTESELNALHPLLDHLKGNGTVFKVLTADEARKIEPALNPDAPLHAAVHLPNDEVGNCRQFALLLKAQATKLGANFRFNAHVAHIDPAGGITLHMSNEAKAEKFDAAVVCAGALSHTLLRPLGIRLPLATIYSYSVSAAVREPLNAPRSAVLDVRDRISISRIGNRVRVCGGSELGGSITKRRESTIHGLYRALQLYFPGAAGYPSGAQTWKGSKILLPDGLPVIGPSSVAGVWLNLAHGANGWGMSCGAARMLSDLIGKRATDIDPSALSPQRLVH